MAEGLFIMGKKKEMATVLQQTQIAPDIFDMWLGTTLADEAKPGQFINVYPLGESTLLPRPISICEAEAGKIRIVYRTVGKGTTEFSRYHTEKKIPVLGPLGNGFDVSKADGKTVFLMGGGIGIPPMVELGKALKKAGKAKKIYHIVGYRDDNTFLTEELSKSGEVIIATEDGSLGTKGTVIDAIEANGLGGDVLMACGPLPMLKALKNYAKEHGMEGYLSLEERMACGVGACLGCVCETTKEDAHSHVKNARVCTDGPVFSMEDVFPEV